jgi:hypothetical protein
MQSLLPPSFRQLLLRLGDEDLATPVGATIGTGMVRKPWPSALRASNQFWQFQVMMGASLSLAGARDALFW